MRAPYRYVDEFDGIGAFDVIEHTEEDQTVLRQIYQALKPGGLLLLTVPQHRWLWSPVDEDARHVRRYTAPELHDKVTQAGFSILLDTSFVTSLLPAMLLSRLLQRGKQQNCDAQAELRISPVLNCLFEGFLRMERKLIQAGNLFSPRRFTVSRCKAQRVKPDQSKNETHSEDSLQ